MQPLTAAQVHNYESAENNIWTSEPNSVEYRTLVEERNQQIPVRAAGPLAQFLTYLNSTNYMLIGGSMGCGKSTQLPQLLALSNLHSRKPGLVVLVVPRRIVAATVAERIRAEMGVRVQDRIVLTCMRQGDLWDSEAKIIVATDGIVLRRVLNDPSMGDCSAVIFDDVHEKGAVLELLMSWSRVVKQRNMNPCIRFAYMSATSDFAELRGHLGLPSSAEYELPSLSHDIQIVYSPTPLKDHHKWLVKTIADEILPMKNAEIPLSGDILVFLTGKGECDRAASNIRNDPTIAEKEEVEVYVLHANVTEAEKVRATSPRPSGSLRRVICATNIAETSLTIGGLAFVIDIGRQMLASFDTVLNCCRLTLTQVSQAQADQRKNRVGRQGRGVVYRGWTEDESASKHVEKPYPTPQIQSQEYTTGLLHNLAIASSLEQMYGYDLPLIPLLNPPSVPHNDRAIDTLSVLKALRQDSSGQLELTDLGFQLSRLSVSPEHDCVNEMIEMCAALSTNSPVFLSDEQLRNMSDDVRKENNCLRVPFGDHFNHWNMYRNWVKNGCSLEWAKAHGISHSACLQARTIAAALRGQMKDHLKSTQAERAPILAMSKCLVAGHLHKIAIRLDPSNRTELAHPKAGYMNWRNGSQTLKLGKSSFSADQHKFLIYSNADLDRQYDVAVITTLMPIKFEWVDEIRKTRNETRF